jgi:hypothetical protein
MKTDESGPVGMFETGGWGASEGIDDRGTSTVPVVGLVVRMRTALDGTVTKNPGDEPWGRTSTWNVSFPRLITLACDGKLYVTESSVAVPPVVLVGELARAVVETELSRVYVSCRL